MLGIIAAIGGAIVSGISSLAGCAAAKAVGVIGKVVGGALKAGKLFDGICKFIPKKLVVDGPVYRTLEVIPKVAKALGITKEEEKPEEVGYRVDESILHDDWKKREDFDKFDPYYEYLKQQIAEINREKLRQNLLAYQMVGTNTLYNEIGHSQQMDLQPEFLVEIGAAKMSPEETQAVIGTFKAMGLDGKTMRDYLTGRRLSFDLETEIRKNLETAYQRLYPDRPLEDIDRRLDTISTVGRDIGALEDGKRTPSFETIKRLYPEDGNGKVE